MPVAKGEKKQKYSNTTKAEVLATLAVTDNAKQLAIDTGIPRTTIQNWRHNIGVNDDVQRISHVKREEIRDLHKLVAVKALGLLQTKMEDCTGAQLSTISGVSTEKYLLLDGQPTQITESRTDGAQAFHERMRKFAQEKGRPEPTFEESKLTYESADLGAIG